MSGLTATGWVPKTAAELLAELEADLRAQLGEDEHGPVDVSAESVFGPVLAGVALKLGELWELTGAVYAARTPTGASGESLDALAGICPGIERRAPTKGRVTLRVTLAPTVTLPAGSRAHVPGEPTNAWVTIEAVTNSGISEAPVDVVAEAIDAGVVRANSSTITAIATPVSGWISVTNPADATPGEGIEGDAALRVRRELMLQRAGHTALGAIVAAVLEVDGVTECAGWENTTLHRDSAGRPGKSVEVLVDGGTDEAVARAIYAAKSCGIEAWGTEEPVTFTDDEGRECTVRFSRPTPLPVWATVKVLADGAYAGHEAVELALLAAAAPLRSGSTVRVAALQGALRAVSGVVDVQVSLGTTSIVATHRPSNLRPPSVRHRAVFDSARITVEHAPL